jgi:hypothetical protein
MSSAEACGPNYLMRFSNQGAKLPYQLVVGGAQLMQNGRECNDERLAGIAVYPVRLVNGQPQTGVSGSVAVSLPGPVVAKITVDWAADYACETAATLQDSTSFTFFPDGHIVRWDHLRQATGITNMNCPICPNGSSGSNFRLTSFMTLGADGNADLSGTAIGGLTAYSQEATGLTNTCLTSLGQRIAFGWRNSGGRIRVAHDSPRALAFVQDIVNDMNIAADFADEVTTHMLVSSTDACSDMRTRASALAERRALMIQTQNRAPGNDGIYGGADDNNNTGYMTQVGDITLTPTSQPIPSGFAVWIDFGSQPNTAVTFTHSAGTPSGEWVRQQRVSTSQIIFYFRDELPAGQTITIHPG